MTVNSVLRNHPSQKSLCNSTPINGLCDRCVDTCTGGCDVFLASFFGRETDPQREPARQLQAWEPDYDQLSFFGGVFEGNVFEDGNTRRTSFGCADTSAVYGNTYPVRIRMPVFAGIPIGSEVGRRHEETLIAGAAVCGIPALIDAAHWGGVEKDRAGKIVRWIELDRRVDLYRRWQDRYGDVVIRLPLHRIRRELVDYLVEKLGVQSIELKWPTGVSGWCGPFGGHSLESALELRRQGRLVIPSPEAVGNQSAYHRGEIGGFDAVEQASFVDEAGFLKTVDLLRTQGGVKRILLRAQVHSPQELALAMKWSSMARLDLTTLAGRNSAMAASGRGIGPFFLQCMACRFASKMSAQGKAVSDLALCGDFSTEDHIFKVLALGSPYFRALDMGRALLIPAFLGDNVEGLLRGDRVSRWEQLPSMIGRRGERPDAIFASYQSLGTMYGNDRLGKMPLGAVAMHTYLEKLQAGLQQLLAATRNFRLEGLRRSDLVSLTDEAARASGIPHRMDAGMDEAERILDT